MGEDRTTCVEKKPNDAVPSRHRHSSIISSCSEDAESEATSAGYPPSPDEERDEELEYGPGIVNKLRTRFLSITLKQNRGTNMRRSCSMENLLDQDRPCMGIASQKRFGVNREECNEPGKSFWGNLKRAKSMDTLLMDLQQAEVPPVKGLQPEINGESKKEPKIIRRRDGGLNRVVPTICDEELPKPDTVKTYKRMFEPAESRRGSHSRRPPVLRASAKSGAASKMNGISSSSSAKVNGAVTRSKYSAKQSPPPKAQVIEEPVTSPIPKPISNLNQPLVNGNDAKPVCNGTHTVKATPVKISNNPVCNGKATEKELNSVNRILNRKEVHFAPKTDIICNGNDNHKELSKAKPMEEIIVNQCSRNGITNKIGVLNSKPKIPPNRPTILKTPKPVTKVKEQKACDKKTPVVPKLKADPPEVKKLPEIPELVSSSKNENSIPVESKIQEETKALVEPTTNGDIQAPETNGVNVLEENNETIRERTAPKLPDVINEDKPSSDSENKPTQNGYVQPAIVEQLDSDKIKKVKVEVVDADAKPDIKIVKKPLASSSSSTTSMVFDFRGKDVVSHVALLPVPFGCKALHPKKRPLLIDGKEAPVGTGVVTDDEDEDFVDYSTPPPSGVIFEGENVKIGRGSILSTRNKDLKITFDDEVDSNTFVYPSESSLMEEPERSLSPASAENEIIPNGQPPPSKLKANTSIGSSGAGGLSTYTPSVLRTMDNFEPGMFRQPPAPVQPEKEEEKNRNNAEGEEENKEVREDFDDQEMLKPADPGIISSWSLSAGTSDLLF